MIPAMRCVMVMFDSLNRRALPPYNPGTRVHAPNFVRLAKRSATFETSYVCSMPCMPARRDFHTGRPNLLHRSWGPMEPFDDSVPHLLKEAGVSSHLITDHQHYFEFGGATYHTQYSSWQFHRGQEGDPCIGQAWVEPAPENAYGRNAASGPMHENDRVNRKYQRHEWDQPQAKTFAAGVDFIDRNAGADGWFLQIETFDPHEPFFTQRQYKDLYAAHFDRWNGEDEGNGREDGKLWDWPPYDRVTEDPAMVEHMRQQYAALVSMCDARLGDVLDAFDRHGMWEDTMLIVWTDHGFLLGEHDWWAKMRMPWYEELARTPFFVWDPRCPASAGQRRSAVVQPALDLGPTLLELFGVPRTETMLGRPLRGVIEHDEPVREVAMFGHHGGQVNVSDGRYVYMRGPASADNEPLYEYTLMPTHMRGHFSPDELRDATLVEPLSFTKGCPVLRISARGSGWAKLEGDQTGTLLFDLQRDPKQEKPVTDEAVEARMRGLLLEAMRACDAPAEQYERLGLSGA